MSACPPGHFRAKKTDPGQIAGAVSALGVSDRDALALETAIRSASLGAPVLHYELEERDDGTCKFTVIVGPAPK